eukprot:SM000052S17686  [mRNA]  locus=s52:80387:80624:- [translate_table: standard]
MEVRDARLLAEARDASSAAHPPPTSATVPGTGSPPPSWDDRQSHEAATPTPAGADAAAALVNESLTWSATSRR